MTDVADWLLTGLLNHGVLLLSVVLFLAALGFPLPATMLLIAAGAFARQGLVDAPTAAIAALAAAVCGDACSYLVGRSGARLIPPRWQRSSGAVRAARLFERWGAWSIFLSRFAFTPLALPVNLLAGSTRYPWPRFGMAVLAGEAVWILLFGGLGHVFADQWETLGTLVGDLVGALLGLLLAGVGLAVLRARGGLRRG